jgi:hypothetical protein
VDTLTYIVAIELALNRGHVADTARLIATAATQAGHAVPTSVRTDHQREDAARPGPASVVDAAASGLSARSDDAPRARWACRLQRTGREDCMPPRDP